MGIPLVNVGGHIHGANYDIVGVAMVILPRCTHINYTSVYH